MADQGRADSGGRESQAVANEKLPADGRSLTPALPGVPISQSPVAKFREYLEIRKLKNTEERLRIVAHIYEEHQHFDAEQLLASMKAKGIPASRPTVYRTLKILVDAGLLRQLTFGGVTAYEHDYGYPQHEHLYCEKCKGVIEFVSDELDQMLEQISRSHRFRMQSHKLVIQGICEQCGRAKPNRRRHDLI